MTRSIAIIPARGGSKRIPRKNIRAFHGKPIIAYAIEAMRLSDLFSRIVVSTEDAEIADVAQHFGADVLARPLALADDHTPTGTVIAAALESLAIAGEAYDYVCCLYATSVFVTPEALKRGHQALNNGAQFAVSVAEFEYPIERALRIRDNGLAMVDPSKRLTRSQDLDPAYHDAAQFYWGRREAWLAELPIFEAHSAPIILERGNAVDIDTEADWAMAEALYSLKALKSTL